jgi:hypothetical protein
MARDPFVSSLKPVVDEQTKAAAMRDAAKGPTPDQALLARAQAQLEKLKALPDPKATAAADRAAAVTANRLATSPIAQEAARTTAALKSFTAKGGLLGVPGSNIQSTNQNPSARIGSNIFQMLDGILYFSGVPFTGKSGDKEYENGIEVGTKNNVDDAGNKNLDKTLVSTDIDSATGDTIGYFSDGSKIVLNKGTGPVQSAEFKDAYALLNQTFRDYGLESLVPAIEGFMKRNLGPNQAAIELRSMPEYIKRFKGNDLRRASGKNALTEAEYLAVEDAYDQTLRAYGQQNYFGIDRKTKQEKAAELIGNDISAVEFKDRIQLAVDRVQNADPMTKSVLKQFYPTLNENDLIGYFLNPQDNLPKLQEKVTASEIGAAAKGFNLGTDVATATDLAKYGVTQAQAREGYSGISAVLPTATKLGDIYNEAGIRYAQAEGEAEVFKGNQDAATKRKRLASMERAAFSGSSGTGQSSLGRSTQGLL